MNATEEPMDRANSILDTMLEYVTNAANGTNNSDDRYTIAAQLKENAGFIYEQNANKDYAGRYLFTGYRTDVPLLFDAAQSDTTYNITENLDVSDIQKYSYVYGQAEYDDSKTAADYANEASEFLETHRILLSYDKCDSEDVTVTYNDVNGNTHTITAVTKNLSDNTTYNEQYHPGDDEVYFVPETGELVFGSSVYDSIRAGSGLVAQYAKTEFEENDIRPEHYFDCKAVNNVTGVEKNYSNVTGQQINYQVDFSQTLTVNTLACNAFDTSIGRAVDDIYNVINDLEVMEQNLTSIQKRIDDCDANDEETLSNLQELYNQVNTQISLQNTVLTNSYSHAITIFQNAKDTLNVAVASHGARDSRLQMTQNGLETLQIDTKEAKSENEEADLEEAYVNYTQADLLYQASLQATAKILGTSLLDFI
jgi:flagellar hook-associated protein 3 FlgL